MALGDHDRALAWLDKLYTGRGAWVRGLKVQPQWDRCAPTRDSRICCDGPISRRCTRRCSQPTGLPGNASRAGRLKPAAGRPIMMFWKRLEHLLPWRRAAEDARGEWGWTRLEQTGQDIRYAIRALSKSPVHAGHGVVARDRHRRQYGALHGHQYRDVEAPASERSGASADDRTTEPGRNHQRIHLPAV